MARKTAKRKSPRWRPPVDYTNPPSLTDAELALVEACAWARSKPTTSTAGLRIFARVVERRMSEYEGASTTLLDVLWRSQIGVATYLERQCRTSAEIFALITNNRRAQTTIDDIVDELFQHFNVPTVEQQGHQNALRHLIFASIGWSTMLYTATIPPTDEVFSTVGRASPPSKNNTLSEMAQRPIGALLRSQGIMPIACSPRVDQQNGPPVLLTVTYLNFFVLSRLGDVSITWVNDLAWHCHFDRYSKKKVLKLFRLPSLLIGTLLSDDDNVLWRLFQTHVCQNGCSRASPTMVRSYLIEILLSYRLLFGQHRKSRERFHSSERKQAEWGGASDPLLLALCGDETMSSFEEIRDIIRERGTYNSTTSFPHLGARLSELAEYSSSQRPRNFLEVWSDQRDPERLFTFKALIVVGIISFVLSVFQILIGIAQVIIAIKHD